MSIIATQIYAAVPILNINISPRSTFNEISNQLETDAELQKTIFDLTTEILNGR